MTDRVTDPAAPTVAGWPAPAVTGRTTRRATPGAWSVALGRWQVMRRQLPLIVATALGTPIFYLLGLGHGLGQSVGVIGQGAGGPVPYVDYIAPALLVAACTAVAITEWTWPIVDGYVWQKNFHPIAHTPLAPRQIAHGLILAGGGRMAFVAVVYTAVMAATGHVRNWWAVPLLPVIGVAGGLAFGLLVLAFATALKRENGLLNNVIRLIYLPMTLFSATFYPLAALPAWLHWIGWISPLWHAAETGRVVAFGQPAGVGVMVWHVGYLAVLIALGWWSTCFLTRVQLHGVGWFSWLPRAVSDPADRVLARVWRVLERVVYPGSRRVTPGAGSERLPGFLVGGPPPLRRTWAGPFRVLNRDLVAMRQFGWMPVLTGFFEPVLYLWSMGLGLGGYMGDQPAGGLAVPYPAFIAPALLATSAMNGAIFDSTTNVFFKLHEIGTYKGMLATPLRPRDVALGELTYALLRGLAYSVAFFIVAQTFDLALSWWAVLAIPAATLVAFGFASLGFAITSFLTSYRQVDWIGFTLVPMFLLSGTFFPLADLPVAVQAVVQVFPLQHAVELIRGLMLGTVGWPLLAHAAYFVVLGIIGPIIASRRITKLFLD